MGFHLQFPPQRRWAVQGQELPETCFETGHATVEFSGCRSRSGGLAACLRQRRVPGYAPGGAVTFFRVAERKSPKKGRPRCPRPLRGNLRCSLQAGSAQTRLAAQTARGPDPPEAVLLGTARGEGEPGRRSGHRCARRRASGRARRMPWGRIQCSAGIGGAVQLSDHDAAQRNACSDPNPGTAGATHVLCHARLRQRI